MGKITVTKSGTSGCTNARPGEDFDVPTRSLIGASPAVINGPSTVNVGQAFTLPYSTSMEFPMVGEDDDNNGPFLVPTYTWTLPTGWTNLNPPATATASAITVATNEGTGGVIRVTPTSGCAGTAAGPISSISVSRVMPKPPTIAAPEFLLCTDTELIVATAEKPTGNFPGGLTYNWTLPTGWAITQSLQGGKTIEIQPNGRNGGNLSVTATSAFYGLTSAATTQTVPLYLVDPATEIIGPSEAICSSGEIFLSLTPLPGIDISWQVTNTDSPGSSPAVYPTSGTGPSALLNLTQGQNGNGAIAFTASNSSCTPSSQNVGTFAFFAGKPKFFDPMIDDMENTSSATVCPGSHTASLRVSGAYSNCITWTNLSSFLGFAGCNTYDVFIPQRGVCATIKATAENNCLTNDKLFFICTYPWECAQGRPIEIYLRLSPNPVSDVLNVEVIAPPIEEHGRSEQVFEMKGVKIFDARGNLKKESRQSGDKIQIQLDGLSNGNYTLQTEIEGQPVSEQFYINR